MAHHYMLRRGRSPYSARALDIGRLLNVEVKTSEGNFPFT